MTYYALLLFFLFDYLRPGNYIPGLDLLRLNALVPITAIMGTLMGKTPVSNRQFFSEPTTHIMLVWLGLLCISTLFATVTLYAFTATKNVFSYMLVYWVVVRQVGDIQRLKGMFFTLPIVHLLVGVLNPALFLNPDSRVGTNSGAFLGDGNDFSLSVNLCIPMCLFLFFEAKKKWHKVAWVLVLVMLVLSIVATMSRGGTLALGSIGLYFWLKSNRKAVTAAIAVLLVAIVFLAAPPTYYKRMSTMTDTQESSARGRIDAWWLGVDMAIEHPILGVGAGQFPMSYGNVMGRWTTAHSVYFLTLGELGLPGITVLLGLMISQFTANRRMVKEVRRVNPPDTSTYINALSCTSASLLGFAVGGAFLSATYYPHLYVLSGLLVATRGIVRRQLDTAAVTAQQPHAADVVVPPALRPGAISPDWRPARALGSGTVSRRMLSPYSKR